jgi:hypothetical protein
MKKSINTDVISKYLTRWGIDLEHELWGLTKGIIKFEDNEFNNSIFYKLQLETLYGVVITKIKTK